MVLVLPPRVLQKHRLGSLQAREPRQVLDVALLDPARHPRLLVLLLILDHHRRVRQSDHPPWVQMFVFGGEIHHKN